MVTAMPDKETLHADGFEDAFVGYGIRFNHTIAIYDWEACIGILMTRDGMTREDAEEYMDFNVTGAYVGEYTPIFLLPEEELADDRQREIH
jgi:hypothetical protein